MSKPYQKLLALGMSGAMIFATATPTFAEETATEPHTAYQKYENVYARLSADGTASDAYVVNHFSIDKAVPIVDYGSYTALKNLTNLDVLADNDGKVLLDAEPGEFYYQGTLENVQLPWLFHLTYTLDGQAISAQDLAGKSGKLKIHFTAVKNPAADSSFYNNYVNQISLTLSNDKAKNIHADGATMADAGADRQLTFTMLPGDDGDYTITADVSDFSMSGFSIAAVPYSMEISSDELGMDNFTDQLDELTDAVTKLNQGSSDLADGASELQNGGYSLLDGSGKIEDGLKKLSGNSATVVDASAQIRDALRTVSTQLDSADFSGLTSLKQLPDGLNQLAGTLDQIQSGLGQLYQGYAQSYQALDTYMAAAKENLPSESDLQLLAMAAGTYDAMQAQQGQQDGNSASAPPADSNGTGDAAASGSSVDTDNTETPIGSEELTTDSDTVDTAIDTEAANNSDAPDVFGIYEEDAERTPHGQPEQPSSSTGTAMAAYTRILNSYKSLMTLLTVYYGSPELNTQGVSLAFQSVLSVLNPDASSPTADQSLYLAISTVSGNIKKISGSMGQLTETDIAGQMNQLKDGLRQLADNYSTFHDGLVSYTNGVNTLAGSYGSYQDGLTPYITGISDLHDGANNLSDGMDEFAVGISDMPNQIQDTIDEMMARYSSADYDAVSFTDNRNANIASVQFVISTDGVEAPAVESVEPQEVQKSFLDRLKALFIRD